MVTLGYLLLVDLGSLVEMDSQNLESVFSSTGEPGRDAIIEILISLLSSVEND